MPQATHGHSTAAAGMLDPSRRRLMGAGASLFLLGAAAAGPAKARELDGQLLAACSAFWRAHQHRQSVDRGMHFSDDQAFEVLAEWHDALDAVREAEARTPEGIHAKAEVLRCVLRTRYSDDTLADEGSHERLAWSLATDILGRATS